VVTAAQLRAALGSDGLRRAVRAGEWATVHRAAYCPRELRDAAATDARLAHQLQCAARLVTSSADLVVSHGSAALLHGLRLLEDHRGSP
jgi:hypothetical protein